MRFGVAVGHAGDARVDDRLRLEAGDLLGDEDAVREAAVRELQARDEVADGEHAVDVGRETLVGGHPATVDRDAGLFVAHAGGVGSAADSDEDQVGLDRRAVLEGHRDAGSVCSTPVNFTPVLKLILRLRNARSSCLDSDGSSSGISVGRPSMIVTSAPNDFHTEANSTPMTLPPMMTTFSGTSLIVSASELVMTWPPMSSPSVRDTDRWPARVGAGVALAVDLDRLGVDELALTLDDRDAAGLDESLEALVEAVDHAVLVGVDRRHVDALERRLHAVVLALAGGIGDLRGVQQRLGRDAARMQAGPAQLALLDQGDRLAELYGAERAGVAAAPPPRITMSKLLPATSATVSSQGCLSSSSCHSTNDGATGVIRDAPIGHNCRMGIFRGRKARTDGGAVVSDRNASSADLDALRAFAESRKGVEGYVEPRRR